MAATARSKEIEDHRSRRPGARLTELREAHRVHWRLAAFFSAARWLHFPSARPGSKIGLPGRAKRPRVTILLRAGNLHQKVGGVPILFGGQRHRPPTLYTHLRHHMPRAAKGRPRRRGYARRGLIEHIQSTAHEGEPLLRCKRSVASNAKHRLLDQRLTAAKICPALPLASPLAGRGRDRWRRNNKGAAFSAAPWGVPAEHGQGKGWATGCFPNAPGGRSFLSQKMARVARSAPQNGECLGHVYPWAPTGP
jgi:hypothetical protein